MLFDRMLIARSGPSLKWVASFFEANPTFRESRGTPETVAAFKDHLRDYFSSETGDDPIDRVVRRICETLEVALGENG